MAHALARAVLICALMTGATTSVLAADAYPYVELGSDDVRVVADPRMDLALRLELIRNARDTIEIANYDVRRDEAFAMPIYSALRDAANRGVRVRLLFSHMPTLPYDRQLRVARYLLNPPTAEPIHLTYFPNLSAQDKGWRMNDTLHEKLMLVDGRYALTTGRGFADEYLYWLDTTFAIKGPLVLQSYLAFRALWSSVLRQQLLYRGALDWAQHPDDPPRPFEPTAESRLADAQKPALAELLEWFKAPSDGAGAARGRVLHYDFVNQMARAEDSPEKYSVDERITRLDDPVVDALVEKLATARTVRMNILSPRLHPRLKAALLACAARPGTSVTLFINTHDPDGSDYAKKLVTHGGPFWAQGSHEVVDLLRAGIKVRGFQVSGKTPWIFLHRKLAVLDDTVIFGSHNFNISSTVANDELSYEIVDPKLSAGLAQLFDADMAVNSESLDAAEIEKESRSLELRLLKALTNPFVGLM